MCKFSGVCAVMDIQTRTKTSCISQTVNMMSSSLAVMTVGSGHLLAGCGTLDLKVIRVFFRNHLCKSMTVRRVGLLTARFRKLFSKKDVTFMYTERTLNVGLKILKFIHLVLFIRVFPFLLLYALNLWGAV
jgi:hypothetical protein